VQPEPLCPCGRITRLGKPGKPFTLAQCCGPYLDDFANTPAPDAHSLMRSRYSAFVLMCADYLKATWHPSTRPTDLGLDVGCKWLGLEVRSHRVIDADQAEVEFVARYKVQGRATRLHERSRFVREQGRWYYLDAAEGDLK
jgi:SEC-C motif domain protein